MRIVNDEPDDRHARLKALSKRSNEGDATEQDIESLLEEIEVIDE
jgi:hypothetical protein